MSASDADPQGVLAVSASRWRFDSNYTKASSSLTRVGQRVDDPSVGPLNLVDLAETFDREIRTSLVVRQP